MQRRHSRQREVIYNFIKDRKDHPTADMVYMNVRKELPNISLGTVYRNLMLLSETGVLARVSTGDGLVRFDPTVTPHSHFICDVCGCVLDIDLDDESLDRMAEASFGGRITGHRFFFRGVCPTCVKKGAVPDEADSFRDTQ